jgi:hypothetical protein
MKTTSRHLESSAPDAAKASGDSQSKAQGNSDEKIRFSPSLSTEELTKLINTILGNVKNLSMPLRRLAYREKHRPGLASAALVLADLHDQGWEISIDSRTIWLERPKLVEEGEDLSVAKARIRASLRVGRDRQLRTPSVQAFLGGMLRLRNHKGRPTSILDLVDDGPQLADLLTDVVGLPEPQQHEALYNVIHPVIELAVAGVKDPDTGLDLFDIWRFFRHTWSLEYRPIPGRSLAFLIRNAARPNRPVMGIGMLASSPRLMLRDHWIGWELEPLTQAIRDNVFPVEELARTLYSGIQESLKLVRWDDLLTVEELNSPSEAVIERLIQISHASRKKRKSGGSRATKTLPTTVNGDVDWRVASELPLFVQKRALLLSKLLSALKEFHAAGYHDQPGEALKAMLKRSAGKRAISFALAELRKAGMATAVPDLSVCGAIAPYNEILGGKLVAALMASEEVRRLYIERYQGQESVIASQMAGRAVSRPVDLLVITTTSLYGVGSSQYNRLHLRAKDHPELPFDVKWEELGLLKGVGSIHLSSETVEALRRLSVQSDGHRWVNNVFGEGTNPRLRQIRQGLEVLGINPDLILTHGTPRILYACEVFPGARQKLLGLGNGIATTAASADAISRAWLRRWVSKRIQNPEVLKRIAMLNRESFVSQLFVEPETQPTLL